MTLEQAPKDMMFEMNFESDASLSPDTTSYDLGDIEQSYSTSPSPTCDSALIRDMKKNRNCVQCLHVNSSAECTARRKHFTSGGRHYYCCCHYRHQGCR